MEVAAALFPAALVTLLLLGLTYRTKTQAENLAAHAVRRGVVELLDDRPGLMLNDLCQLLRQTKGTMQYHLRIMEDRGLLSSVREGRTHRYFLPVTEPANLHSMAVLSRDRIRDLAVRVLEHPGVLQANLTSELAISRKVFRGYANLLSHEGLIEETTAAGRREYRPTPRLVNLLRLVSRGTPKTHFAGPFSGEPEHPAPAGNFRPNLRK